MKRFVIEGEWSGYRSSQRKIVHRKVMSFIPTVKVIQYTDGTTLTLKARPALKYERVQERNAYDSLIDDAHATGKEFVSVDELMK